jgi:hypothetical protein
MPFDNSLLQSVDPLRHRSLSSTSSTILLISVYCSLKSARALTALGLETFNVVDILVRLFPLARSSKTFKPNSEILCCFHSIFSFLLNHSFPIIRLRYKLDALKEISRAWGINPDEVFTREALSQPHRTVIDQSQLEQSQLTQLATALRHQMLKDFQENQTEKSMNSRLGKSSPEEIRTLVKGSRGPYA